MVQQAPAGERVGPLVGDRRVGRERGRVTGQRFRDIQLTRADGEADGVGQQILDLLDFFDVLPELIGQRGQRRGQRAVQLIVQAAGLGQRGDGPMPGVGAAVPRMLTPLGLL